MFFFKRNGNRRKSHTFTDFLILQSLYRITVTLKFMFLAKKTTTNIKTSKRRVMKQFAMILLTFLNAKDVKSKSKVKVN